MGAGNRRDLAVELADRPPGGAAVGVQSITSSVTWQNQTQPFTISITISNVGTAATTPTASASQIKA